MAVMVDEAQPPDSVDMALAGEVDGILARHYPGHPWVVKTDTRAGMLYILHPDLSDTHGVRLKLRGGVANAGFLERAVVRGAGEFLERFDLHRRPERADRDQLAVLATRSRFT